MLLREIRQQIWMLILVTIVKFATSYYLPLCSENGACFSQEVEETTIISGVASSFFDALDITFGWIFHTFDALIEYFATENENPRGFIDLFLDFVGIAEQASAKQKTSPLQKFVCVHHKKVLSTIFILLTSLLYVLNRGGKGNRRGSINDDLDFVENFYRENNDIEDSTSYLDGVDQNDEDY